jgi:hypothetical protein
MATSPASHPSRSRTAAGRKPAAQPAAAPDGASGPARQDTGRDEAAQQPPQPTIDSTLDAWAAQFAREQLAWQIGISRALLRGAKAMREAQMQAAERAEAAYLKAGEQLLQARGVADIGALQLEMARAAGERVLLHATRLGEVSGRGLAETLEEAASGWTRLSAAAWDGLLQWSRWQAWAAPQGELVEAEVEHVTNPIAASPMVWPAQEATRQAMSVAASTWNDWLNSWSATSRPH